MCFDVFRNYTEENMTSKNSARNGKNELSSAIVPFQKKSLNEIIPMTMVLRSNKRKLAQAKSDNERTRIRKKRKSSNLSNATDCIILSDSSSVNPNSLLKTLVTSTPIPQKRPKAPVNFDVSCIQSDKKIQSSDGTTDVIVISDTSTTVPVIVLSDEEEPEIEVISPGKSSKTESSVLQIIEEKEIRKEEATRAVVQKSTAVKKLQISKSNVKRLPLSKMRLNSKVPALTSINAADGKKRKKKKKPKSIRTCKVGENYYLDKPLALPVTGLRPIIIDGSNVAFHHSNNLYFSCRGLEICIKYFKSRGHEVIAFVPQYRVKYKECDNPKLLCLLVKNGDVILTPSSTVNGNRIVPYDDRFIVQTAVIKGGIIVTRDSYRDLLAENPSWAQTIQYRLLQFTWVQDMLMFPNDPLGKRGPSLEEFLRFDSGY